MIVVVVVVQDSILSVFDAPQDQDYAVQHTSLHNSNVNVYGAVIMTTAMVRVHPVHLMNAD